MELDSRTGKNDGSVQGVRYFSCPPGYGLFKRPTALQVMPPDHDWGRRPQQEQQTEAASPAPQYNNKGQREEADEEEEQSTVIAGTVGGGSFEEDASADFVSVDANGPRGGGGGGEVGAGGSTMQSQPRGRERTGSVGQPRSWQVSAWVDACVRE